MGATAGKLPDPQTQSIPGVWGLHFGDRTAPVLAYLPTEEDHWVWVWVWVGWLVCSYTI